MKSKLLWSLSFETSPEKAGAFAEALGDAPVALTVLAPPRKRTAKIEALYSKTPDQADVTSRLAVAAALMRIRQPAFRIKQVEDLDWLGKVAGDFPPLPIARWVIHGAMHGKTLPHGKRGLQIDATNAFGTGEHPTTRGCLLMLDWLLKKGFRPGRMLDMGCGSGILAMGWAATFPGHALAVDCDEDSVRIAKENARVNGLTGKIRVAKGLGYIGSARHNAPYDLIMANIFARPLAQMAKDLRRSLRPGGMAILAGLLTSQANLVLAAHRMQKLYPVRILRIGEWSILVLQRKILKAAPRGNRKSNGRLG